MKVLDCTLLGRECRLPLLGDSSSVRGFGRAFSHSANCLKCMCLHRHESCIYYSRAIAAIVSAPVVSLKGIWVVSLKGIWLRRKLSHSTKNTTSELLEKLRDVLDAVGSSVHRTPSFRNMDDRTGRERKS